MLGSKKPFEKKKRNYAETQHAVAFIQWCRLYPTIGEYIFHCKNESQSYKSFYQKQLDFKTGLVKGIPDYFYAYPCRGKSGLFLELKSEKGKLSEEQKIMLERFLFVGYECVVAYGAKEAIDAIKYYRSDLVWKNDS